MKSLFSLIISLNFFVGISTQIPLASSGTIKGHENFQSKYVTARNVDILLPECYTSKKKYNVLYMQYGHMLLQYYHMEQPGMENIRCDCKLNSDEKLKHVIVVGT